MSSMMRFLWEWPRRSCSCSLDSVLLRRQWILEVFIAQQTQNALVYSREFSPSFPLRADHPSLTNWTMRQTTLAGQSKLYGLKSKVGDTPSTPRSIYLQFHEFRPCSKWILSLWRYLSAIAAMDIVITMVTGRGFVERPNTFSRRILWARFILLSLLQRLGAVETRVSYKSCCASLYFHLKVNSNTHQNFPRSRLLI